MTNTLQNIIRELKEGNHLELGNEHFSNEIIFNESVQCSILGDITFFNLDFRNVDLTGSHVVACDFKNCNFINVNLIASDFSNFEFVETKFKNSKLDFLGVRSIKVWKSKQCTEIEKSSNKNLLILKKF